MQESEEKEVTKVYFTDRQQPSVSLAYQRLAIAIVEQACRDAMGYYTLSNTDKYKKELRKQYQMAEVKRFFYDENGIFPLCMPNTDGPAFYNKVISNWETYGYYSAGGNKHAEIFI